jgi:hypothetical protein
MVSELGGGIAGIALDGDASGTWVDSVVVVAGASGGAVDVSAGATVSKKEVAAVGALDSSGAVSGFWGSAASVDAGSVESCCGNALVVDGGTSMAVVGGGGVVVVESAEDGQSTRSTGVLVSG